MTTIAYKDGVLAADTCFVTGEGMILPRSISKIDLVDGGRFAYTGAGNKRVIQRFIDNLPNTADGRRELPDDGTVVILLYSDGTVVSWTADGEDRLVLPYMAWGSGAHFAMGAMAAGSSAFDAVKIACQLDPYSREPVEQFPHAKTVKN